MELWNFAKQIAQSEGRKDDWIYIVDTYKSIGGKEMTMFLIGKEGKYEVLGEAPNDLVLLTDKVGELSTIEKSEIKKFKKKFLKREETGNEIKKSLTVSGKRITATVYLESTFK